jgi:DNA processing protein
MELASPRFAPREEIFAARRRLADAVRFDGLWIAGSLAGLARYTVAVVGTRAPSDAARSRARHLGEALASAGVCVLSGLALGIDGCAHEGSLAAGGPTLGVLGGGHRRVFPQRNRRLAQDIVATGGGVLSPYAPDEPARPGQFLQRNGVVAALADAVVIVEAAQRSGALNTATWAGALGIDVLAYPGDVERPKAAGCNALIRDGATLVRHPDDVLAAIGFASEPRLAAASRPGSREPASLGPAGSLEAGLQLLLGPEPADLDTLAAGLRAAPGEVLAALVRLEIGGHVERRDGYFSRANRTGNGS